MTDRHDPFSKAADRFRAAGWGVEPPQQFRIDIEPEFLDLWELVAP